MIHSVTLIQVSRISARMSALLARRQQRHRDLVVIAGAREAEGLYMRRSLEWLIDDGVRDVIAIAEQGATRPVLPGRPTHYLPSLGPEDAVYVAGPPLVDAVKIKSRAAAARCYADPFLPNAQPLSLVDRVMAMLRRPATAQAPAAMPVPAAAPAPAATPLPTAASRRTFEPAGGIARAAPAPRRSQVRTRV